jgi:hypothetical protein
MSLILNQEAILAVNILSKLDPFKTPLKLLAKLDLTAIVKGTSFSALVTESFP